MAAPIAIRFTGESGGLETATQRAVSTVSTGTAKMLESVKQMTSGMAQADKVAADAAQSIGQSAVAYSKLGEAARQASGDYLLLRNAQKEVREQLRAGTIDAQTANAANLQIRAGLQAVTAEYRAQTRAVQEGARQFTGSAQQIHGSAGMAKFGIQDLGFQLSDVATQFAGGTRAAVIFAQQGPQIVQAVQMMSGGTSKFAAFMGGPWGAGVMVGVAVLGALAAKFTSLGDETEKALEKLQKDERETEAARQAKERFKTTVEGVSSAILDQQAALKKNVDGLRTEAEQALDAAKKNLAYEISIRSATAALLEHARAQAQAANSQTFGAAGGAGAGMAQSIYAGQVQQIDAALKDAQAKIDIAKANLGTAQSFVDVEAGKRDADPIAKINRLYDGANGLIEQARKRAVAEGKVGAELERQVKALQAQKQAAIDAAEAAKRDARKMAGQTMADFAMPVAGQVTGQFGEKRPGHTHAGLDIAVPVGTGVKAPQAGVVIEAGTLPGYGNVVFIDHGGGTISRLAHLSSISVSKGQEVAQGQSIGLSGGAKGAAGAGDSTGPHVHYEVRVGGRAVDPRKGQFPVDALGQAEKSQRLIEEAARKQQAAIEKAASDAKQYADMSAGLDNGLLQAKRANITDANLIAQIARRQVIIEEDKQIADIQAAAVKNPLIAAHQSELESAVRAAADEKLLGINTQERLRIADKELKLWQAQNDNDVEILHLQENLAVTAEERRKVQLAILAHEKDQERRAAQAVIDNPNADPVAKANARISLGSLDQRYDLQGQSVRQSTQSPLERYISDNDPKLIREKVETLQVQQLEAVRQGIDDAISSALGIKDPFLKGLIDLFIQQVLIQPIAQALQQARANSGGGGGGVLGTILQIGGAVAGGIGGGGGISIGKGINGSSAKIAGMAGMFAEGGKLEAFAEGGLAGGQRMANGMIHGPGSGTSDDILALVNGHKPVLVSNQEAIVNAQAVRKYWPMIDAMNKGTLSEMIRQHHTPRFGIGGLLGGLGLGTSLLGVAGVNPISSLAGAIGLPSISDLFGKNKDDVPHFATGGLLGDGAPQGFGFAPPLDMRKPLDFARNDNQRGHTFNIHVTSTATGNSRADRETAMQNARIIQQQIAGAAKRGLAG